MDIRVDAASQPTTEDAYGGSCQLETTPSPRELDWLCAPPARDQVHRRMQNAIEDMVMLLPLQQIECIAAVAEADGPAAALRLTMQLVQRHGRLSREKYRDMTDCARLYAALAYGDVSATAELAKAVSMRALVAVSQFWEEPAPVWLTERLEAQQTNMAGLGCRGPLGTDPVSVGEGGYDTDQVSNAKALTFALHEQPLAFEHFGLPVSAATAPGA